MSWELLICDNGSRDGTVALAQSWADRLPLRVVVADSIPGAGPARNAGVEAARGEWIGFCDADDEVADGWLTELCTALELHPFVAGRFEGERLNSARTLRSRALDQQDGLQLSSPTVGLPNAGGGNLGIHRSVFLAVGGFDTAVRYLQDTDLCWRVQLAGHPLVFIPDLVVHVRLRARLRDMYRQGRNYGASLASLERRYAGAAARLSAPPVKLSDITSFAYTMARGVPETSSLLSTGRPTPAHGVLRVDVGGDPPAERSSGDSPAERSSGGLRAGVTARVEAGQRAVLGVVRLARFFVANRSSIGAQAWQIGWHVGHRS